MQSAKEYFGQLLAQQLEHIGRLKNEPDWTDCSKVSPIKVGLLEGDCIGPAITHESQVALEHLLKSEVASGKWNSATLTG